MSLYTTMLESTGSLYRPTPGRDLSQGTLQDFGEPLYQGIRCSVQPARDSIILLYAQRNAKVSAQIYLVQQILAQPSDYFKVIDRDGTVSIFQVQGMDRNLYYRSLSPYFLACEKIS